MSHKSKIHWKGKGTRPAATIPEHCSRKPAPRRLGPAQPSAAALSPGPWFAAAPRAASLQRPRCPLPGPARPAHQAAAAFVRHILRARRCRGGEEGGKTAQRSSAAPGAPEPRPRAGGTAAAGLPGRAASGSPVRSAGPGWKLRPSQRFRARRSGADGCGSREALVAASDPAHSPAVLSEAEACSGRGCAGDTVETLPFLERLKQL